MRAAKCDAGAQENPPTIWSELGAKRSDLDVGATGSKDAEKNRLWPQQTGARADGVGAAPYAARPKQASEKGPKGRAPWPRSTRKINLPAFRELDRLAGNPTRATQPICFPTARRPACAKGPPNAAAVVQFAAGTKPIALRTWPPCPPRGATG